ncbi:response regulator [Emcibacter nanhaiensis]|uniref:response regulator n=1 Tax=Emcibacter nanhaiensis TaxID=1505037 RepID=UPI0015E27528|nr:response regulator [Emcibacter nanhaiensis]
MTSRSVILVDDDADFISEMTEYLERLRIRSLVFHSAEDAIHSIINDPDAIVCMDLDLPGYGGGRLLDLVLGVNPKQIFFVISGLDEIEAELSQNRNSPLAIFCKPLDIEKFEVCLKAYLNRK